MTCPKRKIARRFASAKPYAIADTLSRAGYTWSTDPLETFRVLLPAPHVDVGAAGNRFPCTVVERANRARGRAHDQRIVAELLPLRHQRAGPDQTVACDLGAVEHDGAHADQAGGGAAAAVQDHVRADDAIVADGGGKAGVGVHRGVVLDLRALPEFDPLVFPETHGDDPA